MGDKPKNVLEGELATGYLRQQKRLQLNAELSAGQEVAAVVLMSLVFDDVVAEFWASLLGMWTRIHLGCWILRLRFG